MEEYSFGRIFVHGTRHFFVTHRDSRLLSITCGSEQSVFVVFIVRHCVVSEHSFFLWFET